MLNPTTAAALLLHCVLLCAAADDAECPTLRVGIIGAGANTRKYHIPLLQKQEVSVSAALLSPLTVPSPQGVELVSVVNRSPESSARAAAEFGIPQTPSSWQELVQSPDIDAVVIGTWPYTHKEMVVAALAAGKHVLCEARMSVDASEARAMVAAAAAQPGLVAQLVPSPLTLKWDSTIARMVKDNFLGRVVAVNVKGVGSDFAEPMNSPMHWRQDKAFSGGNVLMMGIFYEVRASPARPQRTRPRRPPPQAQAHSVPRPRS
jgi:predicted dehydrogenase